MSIEENEKRALDPCSSIEEQQAFEKDLEALEAKIMKSMGFPDGPARPSILIIPLPNENHFEKVHILNENRKRLRERLDKASQDAHRSLEINKKNYKWLTGKEWPEE